LISLNVYHIDRLIAGMKRSGFLSKEAGDATQFA